MKEYIDELAASVHQQNREVGWWDDPNRCLLQTLQLVNTEICEATEGDRKDLDDDHLPSRKMAEVELADTLIRLVDLAGHCGWKLDEGAQASTHLLKTKNTAARHLALIIETSKLAEAMLCAVDIDSPLLRTLYSSVVKTIFVIASVERYDLTGAVSEKVAYNKTRLDHKRENRAKANGKVY